MITLQGNILFEHKDVAISNLEEPWQKHFRDEVADGNFLRGGQSLLLTGDGAEIAARQWIACLIRGNFPAYRTTAIEAVRRCSGLSILGDSEERAKEFIEAETVLIDDFFEGMEWSDDSREMLVWYFRELHRNGVVILLAAEAHATDLNAQGSVIGALIESTFEVIKHGKADPETSNKRKVKRPAGKP